MTTEYKAERQPDSFTPIHRSPLPGHEIVIPEDVYEKARVEQWLTKAQELENRATQLRNAAKDAATGRTLREDVLKDLHVSSGGTLTLDIMGKIADRLIMKGWHK